MIQIFIITLVLCFENFLTLDKFELYQLLQRLEECLFFKHKVQS